MQDKEQTAKELRALISKADLVVYTKLNHVSRSGLSRNIDLMLIVNNKPLYISASVAELLDYSLAKDGSIKVGGAGMDMGFHLVYNLSRYLYKGMATKKFGDAGYVLRHEWL